MMLPNETRWCGIRDSLLNFVGNTDHMKNLMLGDTYVSQNVKTLIVNDLLCSRVNEIVLDLDEVGKAQNTIQSQHTFLSDAIHLWIGLMETYKWNPQIVEMIESRIDKMDVFSDMALAAYLLDPKYRGEKLSDDQKEKLKFSFSINYQRME